MMQPEPGRALHFDVIVVGAGPAGSSVAQHLARRRRSVLVLEKSAFPRDKACGDGLARRSVELLRGLGLGDAVATHPRIRGVRVVTRSGARDSRYRSLGAGRPDHGTVITRQELDEQLCRRAVEAGAILWERATAERAIVEAGRVQGVSVRRGNREEIVRSAFVVAADGGNSVLARKIGWVARDRWATGFALRGYFDGIDDVGDLFEFRVPLTEPGGQRTVPGYAWVFPVARGRANIGVGYFPSQARDFELNIRRIYDAFVQDLAESDPRFRNMHPVGEARGAPLNCSADFSQCAAPGIVRVGDAAGLVDPFTGEGIDTALESGELAARVLDDALSRADPDAADLSEYGRLLAEKYRDRFHVGKQFIRKHGFMWKLLTHTQEVRRPLYESLRSAIVDYGVSEKEPAAVLAKEFLPWLSQAVLDDVQAVDDRLAAVVTSGFPLLGKVSVNLLDATGRFVRPILLALTANCGASKRSARIEASTAIELAQLALLAQRDTLDGGRGALSFPLDGSSSKRRDGPTGGDRAKGQINWCNMFAIMAGDYLLARSYGIAASLGSRVSAILSAQCAEVCSLRIQELEQRRLGVGAWPGVASDERWPAPEQYLEIVGAQNALSFASACRLGAVLGGLPDTTMNALADYGYDLGLSIGLMEELPQWVTAAGNDQEAPTPDALSNPMHLARSLALRAKERLAPLAAGPQRAVLEALADDVVQTVSQEGSGE